MILRFTHTIVLLLLTAFFAGAQVLQQDLAKLYEVYQSHPNMVIELEYRVYKNHSDREPLQIEKGLLKKNGDLFYSRIGELEIINTLDLNCMINSEDRMILLSDAFPMQDFFQLADFNSLNDHEFKVIEAKKLKNGNTYYKLITTGEYQLIELFIGKDHFPERLVLYSSIPMDLTGDENAFYEAQSPRMEIVYQSIVTQPFLPESHISCEAYLRTIGNTLTLQPEYAHFELVDNRSRGLVEER